MRNLVVLAAEVCLVGIVGGCISAPQGATLLSPQPTPSAPISSVSPISPPASISFEIIAEGSPSIPYRTDEAFCRVFTEPGDAPNLGEIVSRDAGSGLDFDHYIYVAVFGGRKPTTQYYFVTEQVTFDDGLVVLALQLRDDGLSGEKETWPYTVLAIDKTAQLQGNITFVAIVDGHELCRMQRHVAPSSTS